MAWIGYFDFAGTEIINVQRTETYAKNAGLTWFKPVYKNEALSTFKDEDYNSPLQDDVAWFDPDESASTEFHGFYPLDVTGIEDSTVQATVTESTLDGGVVGRTRRATRTMVFNGVLVASSECGAEYGLRWLRGALTGAACSPDGCSGSDLCYLSCEPCLPPPEGCGEGKDVDCFEHFQRSLRDVTIISGPVVERKMEMNDGGAAWNVQFTAVAANPVEFGAEKPYIAGFMDPNVDTPFPDGVVPEGATWDENGFVQTDPKCPTIAYTPVTDPLCPLVLPPPPIPEIELTCFTFPVNYRRRQFTIPRDNIPLWGDVAPVISVHAHRAEVRSMRLRFYADVLGEGDPNIDPCAFCGDIVFSYIPRNHTLVFDAASKEIYVESPSTGKRRADSLVFGSDGKPFDWPYLTCGFGYIVTLDMRQTQKPPVVDMSLVSRVR